jgi:hypothetical protein
VAGVPDYILHSGTNVPVVVVAPIFPEYCTNSPPREVASSFLLDSPSLSSESVLGQPNCAFSKHRICQRDNEVYALCCSSYSSLGKHSVAPYETERLVPGPLSTAVHSLRKQQALLPVPPNSVLISTAFLFSSNVVPSVLDERIPKFQICTI